jgi:hypothetical protein
MDCISPRLSVGRNWSRRPQGFAQPPEANGAASVSSETYWEARRGKAELAPLTEAVGTRLGNGLGAAKV